MYLISVKTVKNVHSELYDSHSNYQSNIFIYHISWTISLIGLTIEA
jgi:hypothetical protein